MTQAKVVLAVKFVCVLLLWYLWKHTAKIEFCLLAWVTAIAYGCAIPMRSGAHGRFFILAGITSNALVTLLNNGVMPVNGMPVTMVPSSPIWGRTDGARWLVLADQHALYYFSVGDLLALTGLLLYVSYTVYKKVNYSRMKECTMKALYSMVADERGQDIAEYAVMLAVILVIVVGTIRLIGSGANNVFSQTASSLSIQ